MQSGYEDETLWNIFLFWAYVVKEVLTINIFVNTEHMKKAHVPYTCLLI